MKYESSISYGMKVMAKDKDFHKYVKLQSQGTKSKIMILCERSCHKGYRCEISNSLSHMVFK